MFHILLILVGPITLLKQDVYTCSLTSKQVEEENQLSKKKAHDNTCSEPPKDTHIITIITIKRLNFDEI